MDLNCVFQISASHFLTDYHGKCENMHGHNYKLIVTISGQIQKDGMVMDYKEIKKITEQEIIEKLDHHHLNDIIPSPTSENIAVWIWNKLIDRLPLIKITVYETENNYCEYYGK